MPYTLARAQGTQRQGDAGTKELDLAYRGLAAEYRRGLIGPVPGSGPVRGVSLYEGDVYAFRDNAGATATVMFKAGAFGWTAQSFGHTIDFTAGTAEFTEGETLTGGTSGATATIQRVVLQSGTYGANDAAGYMVLSGVTGTFQAETVTSAAGSATSSSTAVAITIPAGAKVKWLVHNFYGASNLQRLYFVTGVGPAYEWDGSVLAPIRTGTATNLDKPTHIAEFSEHLFLGFRGGSLQWSGTGKPLSFMALDGAGENGVGEDITGLGATKTALVITCATRIDYLSGTDNDTFQIQPVTEDSGALPETFQIIGQPKFMDNRGVRSLQSVEAFGNFRVGTDTQMIEPLLRAYMGSTVRPAASARVRRLDIYRLYFDDGSGISIYYGRERPECMTFNLGLIPACVEVGFDSADRDVIYAGNSTDGYVYQMDKGSSFDGVAMEHFVRLAYYNDGRPNQAKRWHSANIEVATGPNDVTLGIVADFDYGDNDQPAVPETTQLTPGAGGIWDISIYDQFQWGAAVQGQIAFETPGIGANIALSIVGDSTYETAHTLSSLTYFYAPRKSRRLAA